MGQEKAKKVCVFRAIYSSWHSSDAYVQVSYVFAVLKKCEIGMQNKHAKSSLVDRKFTIAFEQNLKTNTLPHYKWPGVREELITHSILMKT